MPWTPTPSRLAAFSDGVIAVIITIMVLELKVPAANGFAGFETILPSLAVYLLSFVFTGIYWVNHHHIVDRLKEVDVLILWTNMGLLFSLSLLPFFTNYMIEKRLDSFSVALYCASLMVTALSYQIFSLAIGRRLQQANEPEMTGELRRHRLEAGKGWVSLSMYVAGMLLALHHHYLALMAVSLVTLIWIVPSFGTRAAAERAAKTARVPVS